jgi:hypothetical protein
MDLSFFPWSLNLTPGVLVHEINPYVVARDVLVATDFSSP